jgi:hypothetical protein
MGWRLLDSENTPAGRAPDARNWGMGLATASPEAYMAQQDKPRDAGIPDDPAGREPAEGARDNVNADSESSGISNRPIEQEQREQQNLPPRGESKRERGEHDA